MDVVCYTQENILAEEISNSDFSIKVVISGLCQLAESINDSRKRWLRSIRLGEATLEQKIEKWSDLFAVECD